MAEVQLNKSKITEAQRLKLNLIAAWIVGWPLLILILLILVSPRTRMWSTSQNQDLGNGVIFDLLVLTFNYSLPVGKNKRSNTSGKVTHRPCSSLRVNLEAANKFIPNNPFFKVSLGASHMEKSNVVRRVIDNLYIYTIRSSTYFISFFMQNVPTSFIRSFIKRLEKQTVMLQIKDRSWPVNLIPYTNSNRLSAKLCGGWAAFGREHNLKGGDVCVFEFMEMKANLVLEVHIFRCWLGQVMSSWTVELSLFVILYFIYVMSREWICSPH